MNSFLGQKLARGIRNNNPGNLVKTSIDWQGKIPLKKNTDGHFEQFTNVQFGIRAMLKDLINDINKGKNTVTSLIREYAPPHENNTQKYIDDVSKSIGIKPNEPIKEINSKFLHLLARAIITKENGSDGKKITDYHITQAIDMLGNVSTSKLKVYVDVDYIKRYMIPVLIFFYTCFTVAI